MATKRKPTRKRLTMIVEVSVPIDLSAADARREVRSLITHQANWSYAVDEHDVKAISVKGIRKWKN